MLFKVGGQSFLSGPQSTNSASQPRTAAKLVAESDGLAAIRGFARRWRGRSVVACSARGRAEATSIGRVLGPAGAMLSLRQSRSPLQLFLTPACNLKLDAPASAKAIVFVNNLDQRVRTPQVALAALFGLIPAKYGVIVL